MVNIEDFKNKIRKGLAKPNRYSVTFTFPINGFFDNILSPVSDLKKATTNNAQTLSILCESAELPGALTATNEDKQFGPFRKMPYLTVYNDVSLTFMCDEDMLARSIFDSWRNSIIDNAGFKVSYYDEYVATMNVKLLSQNQANSVLYEIDCFECYPIEVLPQQLAYENTDSYLRVEVRMAYRYWQFSSNTAKDFII